MTVTRYRLTPVMPVMPHAGAPNECDLLNSDIPRQNKVIQQFFFSGDVEQNFDGNNADRCGERNEETSL